MIEWIDKNNRMPNNDERVLTYSPAYDTDDPMAFRIMDGQFVRISIEVTHWTQLSIPSQHNPK